MPTILLVEDERMLAEMYQERFEAAGIDVAVAPSAEEGLAMLENTKPDLILLDILLPRGNGISFLKKLREREGELTLPVVAFSNYDESRTKEEALKLGVKEYLIKTQFTPSEIVERVKGYLVDTA